MEGWNVAKTEGLKVADTNLFEGWKVSDTFSRDGKLPTLFFDGW